MDNKEITLGQKIKRYRLINDIRQEDMAFKLNISRATLINYEKGHTAISLETLNRLTESYPDFDKGESKPKIIEDSYTIFLSYGQYLKLIKILYLFLHYHLCL